MTMTQRYAGMLRRQAGAWDKQDLPVQGECARQAARHMEDRESALAVEIARLRVALRFYAGAQHYNLDDMDEFDTVSGEPQNWLCMGRDDSTTMIENGQVARCALQGEPINWIDGGEDNTPPPIEGEQSCVARRPTMPMSGNHRPRRGDEARRTA